MNAQSSLTLGDSHYVDGNYDTAIENYTAAICMTDSRRTKVAAEDATATTENGNATAKNANEIKSIRFKSLTHRSETYLSLSKYPNAYNDAAAALALYPPSDAVDDSSPSASGATGLASAPRSAELALAHDRIARASVGLAEQNMGIGGRSKTRVAFVKMSHPSMGESEMAEVAREHWESALVLAGLLVDAHDDEKNSGEDSSKQGKKKASAMSEGARLVDRFQKELKKLDGEEAEEEDAEAEEKPVPVAKAASGKPSSANTSSSPKLPPKPSPARSSSSAARSSSSAPPKQKSNHPASIVKTTPVDRGVMSGMPKYQYYQDDNFMKIQILEPNVAAENLIVDFSADELTVKIKKIESTGEVEYTVIFGDLYEEVIPEKCRAIRKAEKILIKLKKKEEKLDWNNLLDESKAGDRKKGRLEKRAEENGDAAVKNEDAASNNAKEANKNNDNNEAIPTIAKSDKSRPYSSHRDWNAIDKSLSAELAAEKPEGDEALNSLFQSIYKGANEDTKRAMVKSMQTSGGTCLSTNWDEVETTDYEKERQAPKGMEWKDYEGRKLAMKEDD